MTSLDQFLQAPAASLPSAAGATPEAAASEKPPVTGSDGVSHTTAPQPGTAPVGSEPVHAPEASQESAPEEEAQFVTALTPSGIEVLYQWAPKRLYRLRVAALRPEEEGGYPTEWREVPSVTTVLGVLDKAALPWWGMKMGVEGVLELSKRGLLREAHEGPTSFLAVPGRGLTGSTLVQADVDNVVALLNEFQLTVNHKRDKAGDRGQSVHDAFEAWAVNDVWPQPEVFPETERGYVQGLVRFLEDAAIEPGGTEIMVGSLEHGFAGRYDLRAIMADSNLCTKLYPKRADKFEMVGGGSCLLDLKTSAGVYDTHEFQLEAYEAASVECGYTPTDFRAVIRVSADGRYEFVKSKSTFEDFLGVKAAYDARESRKRRKKRPS